MLEGGGELFPKSFPTQFFCFFCSDNNMNLFRDQATTATGKLMFNSVCSRCDILCLVLFDKMCNDFIFILSELARSSSPGRSWRARTKGGSERFSTRFWR
jgi:hypothetical protein